MRSSPFIRLLFFLSLVSFRLVAGRRGSLVPAYIYWAGLTLSFTCEPPHCTQTLNTMKSNAILVPGLAAFASAAKHHLITGTFSGSYLYALEFDDVAETLTLTSNLTAAGPHPWISLSHDKKALYATDDGSWHSYSVSHSNGSSPSLQHSASVPITGDCQSDRGIYIIGGNAPPYNVYADPFGDCANVVSVESGTGALSAVAQNVSYTSGSSGVHGLALHPSGKYLYSADDSGNAVWTHAINNGTGLLELVSKTDAPSTGANPRHAAVHPLGGYLYVVLEESNELAQYRIDARSGKPVFDNVTFPLIADGMISLSPNLQGFRRLIHHSGLDTSLYWSDDVAVSPSGCFLYASSRARETNSTGYISAYELSSDGRIAQQLLLQPTTTSGGSANALAAAPWADSYVALTDTQERFVQIWKLERNATSAGGMAVEAKVVGRVDVEDGGCCANAVWLD